MGKMSGLEKCFKDFDSFYLECIDEHLNPQKPKSYEEDEDFIDILLQLMKDELFSLTYDHIKAMLMVINICFLYWLNMYELILSLDYFLEAYFLKVSRKP